MGSFQGKVYNFSPGFQEWLRTHRPGAARILEGKGRTQALVVDEGRRVLLAFPGVPAAMSKSFDRRLDTDDACLVLDGHPEELATSQAPVPDGVRRPWHPKEGDRCFVDALLLGRREGKDLGKGRKVPAEVSGRVAYMVHLKVEGVAEEVLFDVDEVNVVGSSLVWPAETPPADVPSEPPAPRSPATQDVLDQLNRALGVQTPARPAPGP